jgi:ribonucleoside-diphosphate reductase beta chain
MQHFNFSEIKQEDTAFSKSIFNIEKKDYYTTKLFSGEPGGLFNTLHIAHPRIEKLFKKQKAQDWDEQETLENNESKLLFKTLADDMTIPMKRTLGFQWETDTSIGRILAKFACMATTSDQLFEIYIRIVDNENLHARTYSEIVKMSFDDPDEAMRDILSMKETIQRLSVAGKIFSKMSKTLSEVDLGLRERDVEYYKEIYLFLVALYCVERIQFLSSFAITFCYGDSGLFMDIANSVKKICQDEYEIHVRLGRYLLDVFAEDAITVEAKMLAQPFVKEIIDEIYEAEMRSLQFQLETCPSGLLGYSVEDFASWVKICSADVYAKFGIKPDFEVPQDHALSYMKDWVVLDNFQQSPQEEDSVNYILGPLIRDDKDKIYDITF